jgi:hypothetical protein
MYAEHSLFVPETARKARKQVAINVSFPNVLAKLVYLSLETFQSRLAVSIQINL